MTDATPAGWYPNPAGGVGRRYWDGSAWTDHVESPPWILPAPRQRAPVWLWVVGIGVGGIFLMALAVAIAVPTFLGAQERARDRAAQSSVRNARVVILTMQTDGATELTPENMHMIEPGLAFTVGESMGPKQVSVFVRNDATTIAVKSSSGTCWVMRSNGPIQAGLAPTTGRMATGEQCHAALAAFRMVPEAF
jgi:type II secretory pathway pseudopilin PulG